MHMYVIVSMLHDSKWTLPDSMFPGSEAGTMEAGCSAINLTNNSSTSTKLSSWKNIGIKVYLQWGKTHCFLWSFSLLNVNIKLDSPWNHVEATSHFFTFRPNIIEPLGKHVLEDLYEYKQFFLVAKRFAGVVPEVNLRNPWHEGDETFEQRGLPCLWNPGKTSPKVQNRGIIDPHKKGPKSSKFIFKKDTFNNNYNVLPQHKYVW